MARTITSMSLDKRLTDEAAEVLGLKSRTEAVHGAVRNYCNRLERGIASGDRSASSRRISAVFPSDATRARGTARYQVEHASIAANSLGLSQRL
jgi:Arc/MetJ family transcription regulator